MCTLHKLSRPSENHKGEIEVQNLVDTFNKFHNPFRIENTKQDALLCLSSRKEAKIACDLLKYQEQGEKAATDFIQYCFFEKTVKFQEPLKKLKLTTFANMSTKRTLSATKKKSIQIKAEHNLLGRLLFLSQQNNIDLEKLQISTCSNSLESCYNGRNISED